MSEVIPCATVFGLRSRANACRAELQREARQYAARPEPVTRGCVEPAPPWLDEPWRAQAGDERGARADEERIRVEASWGRWLWLVAELAPTGAPQLHVDVQPWHKGVHHAGHRELPLMGRTAETLAYLFEWP